MFVACEIPPDSSNPVLVKDVYLDADRHGEYLYYVACDEAAVMLTGDKPSSLTSLSQEENSFPGGIRVREADCMVSHAVSVSFHNEKLAYAQSVIDNGFGEEYDLFNEMRMPLELNSMSIGEFMSLTPQRSTIHLQLGNSKEWAAAALFNKSEVKAKFQFLHLLNNRVIEVTALCKSLDTHIGDIVIPWSKLVARYKDMPMTLSSSANRW